MKISKLPAATALFCATCFSGFASETQGAIRASFTDGVPADTITVTNDSGCSFGAVSVLVDLSGSSGGLYFDVTSAGAGVEVFQPLVFRTGSEFLAVKPSLSDGDNSLVLELSSFDAGAQISFTTDLDDTTGVWRKVVSDSEITGARLQLKSASGRISAAFNDAAVAAIPISVC